MKKLIAIFVILVFIPGVLRAADSSLNKMGGTGTIENGLYLKTGLTGCGTNANNCTTGVTAATGTSAAVVVPNGSSAALVTVGVLKRWGSIYQRPPPYLPGTRDTENMTGGTAPNLTGSGGNINSTFPYGLWCDDPNGYGQATNGCFPGGGSAKLTGKFKGGLYAMWSCNGGFYAPNVLECIEVEGGYYSPFRELDKYACPANSFCPSVAEYCTSLVANIDASMTENTTCGAAPISCSSATGGTHTLSDALSDDITQCYYEYNGCSTTPNATEMHGRIYYGDSEPVCWVESCADGYSLIDGGCYLGCPAGHYMNGTTCVECAPGSYCPGGYVQPQDCPVSHSSSVAGTASEEDCYTTCSPMPSGVSSGFDYYKNPGTCVATACESNFRLIDGTCAINCPAGQYSEDQTTCKSCPAGYYCPQNDPKAPLPCLYGFYCPSGSASMNSCPETHSNSQPLTSEQTLCYSIGACSSPNATTSEQRNYFNNSSANICVALTCKSGYTVVDGLCKTESGVTIVTLNKGGGTGTLLSVSGTTSATITCNDHKCNFPSVETLTRANSTYQYSTDGTYHQEGQWCTQPNGGGDCYTPEQIHEINTPTITLYAMWNCRGGYYASTPTSCTAAGAGYYSPKYSNERIECEPGYYCAGTTSATHLSCPIRYPKSDPRNISNMTCYRDCPEMPGALTIAEGGHEYQGLPSTCAATSCMDNWELVENACIPLNASCPPGYYYDGSCKDCPPGNFCVGDEEPLVACPASHSMSDFRNPSQSTCYSPCLPGEHNAVLMSGRNYYDDAYSTCRATFCMNGFTLEDGICVRSQCPVGQFLNNDVCDTCGVGQWYDAERGDGCTPVGSEYYSPTNDSRRYECPSGTLSGGDGNYAASMADCANFKTLMVYDGTNTVGFIMRTSQITTPALRVWDGDNIYYGNVSTQSSGGKQLQITNTNGTYYLRDNVYTP